MSHLTDVLRCDSHAERAAAGPGVGSGKTRIGEDDLSLVEATRAVLATSET